MVLRYISDSPYKDFHISYIKAGVRSGFFIDGSLVVMLS